MNLHASHRAKTVEIEPEMHYPVMGPQGTVCIISRLANGFTLRWIDRRIQNGHQVVNLSNERAPKSPISEINPRNFEVLEDVEKMIQIILGKCSR